MKKHILFTIITLLGTFVFYNCAKTTIVSPDDFTVATTDTVFRVGDTVKFNMAGHPDQVVFYSGEVGMRYAYANRTSDTSGYTKLFFQSSLQQGVLTNGDSLRLLVSSNLKGYDKASILKATWTDITSRNTKWPATVSNNFVNSDSINLFDFKNVDSINIAFRYIGKKGTAAQQRWKIQGFTLIHILPDGTKTGLFAAPQTAAGTATSAFQYTGWVQCSMKNDTTTGYNVWNVGAANISAASALKTPNGITIASGYPLIFDPGPSVNNPDNDDWVITSKVSVKQVKPDFGVTIKGATNTSLTRFNAVPITYYKTPGTYLATFVAINQDIDKTKKVVRQVKVKVIPR
ncbi:MAG: DUF5017 domain-containing protein [Bacteroidota bacterium]|nr:DUF5017 domain-containing protein [Bacteroidota bacterium]